MITAEEVAEATREWSESFASGEIEKGLAMESTGVGFGYRSPVWRDIEASGEAYFGAVRRWLRGLSHYSAEYEELQSRVVGDIGFAWGTYVEHVEEPGKPRITARVRFSHSLRKNEQGEWRFILFHRDAQTF